MYAVRRDLRKECQQSAKTARADLQYAVVQLQHVVTSHVSMNYSTATAVKDTSQGLAVLKDIDQGHIVRRPAPMTRISPRARHVSKVITAVDQCLIRQVSCKLKKASV